MAEPTPSEFGPYRRVQAGADAELKRILEATAIQIRKRVASLKPGVGGDVRAAQLRLTLSAIRQLHKAMWTGRVDPLVKRAMEDATGAAESVIETMTRVAYAALPDKAAEELVRGLRLAAESGLRSDAARKRRELSERVYKIRALHEGKIEEVIRAGLIANLSPKELAGDVYKYVSPSAPGGASYAALRLARTEINNAFHERQVQGATRPGVQAVQWNLSGSHKVPDECNVYAEHDPYPPGEVPDKPHPQCFCYLTYVTMPPEEFREKLAAGDFDDEIDRRMRENLARLGQPVGNIEPAPSAKPVEGTEALTMAPIGLYRGANPETFTSDMQTALKRYHGIRYEEINEVLREKETPSGRIKGWIDNIDAAMKLSPLRQAVKVYRGLGNAERIFGDLLSQDLTGTEWIDDAYTSTTADTSIANGFIGGDQPLIMEVLVGRGVPAIELTGSEDESELLLDRGQRFRVVKDEGIDSSGVRRIKVEVVA